MSSSVGTVVAYHTQSPRFDPQHFTNHACDLSTQEMGGDCQLYIRFLSGMQRGSQTKGKQKQKQHPPSMNHMLWGQQGKAQFLLVRHLGVPKTILQKPRAEWNKSFKSTAQMQKLSTHFCLEPALLCHLSIVPRSWIYTHLQRPWHTALHSVFTHTPWQNCSTENTLTMISSESVIKFCNKHMVFNVENTNLACSLGEEASTFN